ncbi:hypothetical protein ACFLYL_00030 [Chloroflexota bacterium]
MGNEYQTTKTNRFYPGRISEQRARDIQNFDVTIDELTVDDILHGIARNGTTILYTMFDIVKNMWGEEAAVKVWEEYTHRRAKAGFSKWLAKNGVNSGTPELMAAYQDRAHSLSGPAAASAYTTYDDEKCVIIRTSCFYHSFRPEGMKSLCGYGEGKGFMSGYMEADPAIKKVERPRCLSHGDNGCTRIIWYK